METRDIKEPNLWIPISDPLVLAAIGKLGEEASELGAIIFRCVIQGLDGKNPETGELNINDLLKEIADVRGLSNLVIRQLELDVSAISERAEKKRIMKRKWIDMIEEHFR